MVQRAAKPLTSLTQLPSAAKTPPFFLFERLAEKMPTEQKEGVESSVVHGSRRSFLPSYVRADCYLSPIVARPAREFYFDICVFCPVRKLRGFEWRFRCHAVG
jgi:hypothetical protein